MQAAIISHWFTLILTSAMPQVTDAIQQQLNDSSKTLKRFLLGQYFSDGLRITLGILLPSIIWYNLGDINTGIAISLGALCVSIPDTPGPFEHRRNAMLITMGLIFGMALLTGLLVKYSLLLAIFIAASCFFFSMMHVFGSRAASVGVSVLVVMILGIDQQVSFLQALYYALFVALGGAWYFLLSLFSQKLRPYRAAEQLLGECILQVARFIELKSNFYHHDIQIEEQYRKIIDQQAIVNEYQEHVREILFKTRRIINDSTPSGRVLLLTFVDLVDLYEQSMATHYNYADIHAAYGSTGILPHFEQVIKQMADELAHIGNGLHNHQQIQQIHHFIPKLNLLKSKVDELESQGYKVQVLKRILINLRNISNRIERMYAHRHDGKGLTEERSKELTRFVQPQVIDWNLFKAHLNTQSSHFRHAARVALVCTAAFILARTFYQAQYSYWILLTILVILKPGFSLTKKRNYERVIGTIVGGIIGLVILKFFPGVGARFAFLTVLMILAFSFMRVNYVVSVLFMTPYVLIVFSFTGNDNGFSIAWERIIDTLIGATLAFGASYFIFPSWESHQLKNIMLDVVRANMDYLKTIVERNDSHLSQSTYRLARKELYVKSSNLTTAFQRMLTEPKSKQLYADQVFRFTVLNNQLTSYLATLSYQLKNGEQLSGEDIKWARSVYALLHQTSEKLNQTNIVVGELHFAQSPQTSKLQADLFMAMHQTASDIKKEVTNLNFTN